MMEQQFARFLLDRIDERVKGMSNSEGVEIRLHLKELRNIVETTLGSTPSRGRKVGEPNA